MVMYQSRGPPRPCIVSTSRFIRDTGSPVESCYPYLGRDSDCGQACSNWRTVAHQVNSYVRVTQMVAALKSALYSRGPINVGMMVYSDFSSYNSGIYEYSYGDREGGYAVLIVGYDDGNQCFIVKNSWGSNWGENGYFRIAYNQVDGAVDFGAEACVYGEKIDHDPFPFLKRLVYQTVLNGLLCPTGQKMPCPPNSSYRPAAALLPAT